MKCVKCSETLNDCARCFTSDFCYECITGTYLNTQTRTCYNIWDTPVGYYADDATGIFLKCANTLEYCEECIDSFTCTKCMNLSILNKGKC